MDNKRIIFKWMIVFVWVAVVAFGGVPAQAQSPAPAVEVVETQIGFGQVIQQGRQAASEEKMTTGQMPQDAVPADKPVSGRPVYLPSVEFVTMSQVLKHAIEANSQLNTSNDELVGELRFLRGQRQIELNRIDQVTQEMISIRDRTQELVDANRRYTVQVNDLRSTLTVQQEQYELKLKEMGNQLAKAQEYGPGPEGGTGIDLDGMSIEGVSGQTSRNVLALLNRYNRMNDSLRADTARVHYNIGNAHFHKGDYVQAIREYKKAIKILPSDPETHFNLAFVSSEYLRDYETALNHYQEYLYLDPEATDAPLVREKILEARLKLRTVVDSSLEAETPYDIR